MRGPDEIANLQEEQEGEFGEQISINRALELIREKIGNIKTKITQIYQIATDHENRIGLCEDQWDTIKHLCDERDRMARQLALYEAGLIAQKALIVENEAKFEKFEKRINDDMSLIDIKEAENIIDSQNMQNELSVLKFHVKILFVIIVILVIYVLFRL